MPWRYRKIFLIPNQLCVVGPMALGYETLCPNIAFSSTHGFNGSFSTSREQSRASYGCIRFVHNEFLQYIMDIDNIVYHNV